MDTTRRQFLAATAGCLLLAAAPLSADGESSKPLAISLDGIKMDPGITLSVLMSAGDTPILNRPLDPTTFVRHETPERFSRGFKLKLTFTANSSEPVTFGASATLEFTEFNGRMTPLRRTIKSAKTGKEYVAFDCVVRVYEEPTKFRIAITGP